MKKRRNFYPETLGEFVLDVVKYLGIPMAIIGVGSGVIAGIDYYNLSQDYQEDCEAYQTEIQFQKNLAEMASKQAKVDFLTLQITEVSLATDQENNYLILKGKGTVDVNKGTSDFSIVLNVSDYYKPILEKDIKYLNRFSQIEEYEEWLNESFPQDSLCFIYKKDLVNTLYDLIKSPSTYLESIYNASTLEELYVKNNSDDDWER